MDCEVLFEGPLIMETHGLKKRFYFVLLHQMLLYKHVSTPPNLQYKRKQPKKGLILGVASLLAVNVYFIRKKKYFKIILRRPNASVKLYSTKESTYNK